MVKKISRKRQKREEYQTPKMFNRSPKSAQKEVGFPIKKNIDPNWPKSNNKRHKRTYS